MRTKDTIPNKKAIARRVVAELTNEVQEAVYPALNEIFHETDTMASLMRWGIFLPDEIDLMMRIAAEDGMRRALNATPLISVEIAPDWEEGRPPAMVSDFLTAKDFPKEDEA